MTKKERQDIERLYEVALWYRKLIIAIYKIFSKNHLLKIGNVAIDIKLYIRSLVKHKDIFHFDDAIILTFISFFAILSISIFHIIVQR